MLPVLYSLSSFSFETTRVDTEHDCEQFMSSKPTLDKTAKNTGTNPIKIFFRIRNIHPNKPFSVESHEYGKLIYFHFFSSIGCVHSPLSFMYLAS